MPIKKISRFTTAVGSATREYAKRSKEINARAEREAGKSGSMQVDIRNQAQLARKMRKEEGVTLRQLIKKRLK